MQVQKDIINRFMDIRWLRHLLFWILYILTMSYIHATGFNKGEYLPWINNYLIELPVVTGLTYSITYLLIPVLLYHKRYILFLLFSLFAVFFFSFLNIILENTLIIPLLFPEKGGVLNYSLLNVLMNGFGLLYPLGIFLTLTFIRYNYKKQGRLRLDEQEAVRAQLQLIRNQMHPVFLQDAMNELYIATNVRPSQLPAMVLKLSEILNYLLFECNSPRVGIKNEIRAMKGYLEFHQSVHPKSFSYDFSIKAEFAETTISPYILLPLIRSVCLFSNTNDEFKGKISVKIDNENNKLIMEIRGEKEGVSMPSLDFSWQDELNRAKNRLDSVYFWKHKLDVRETEYKLKIDLNLDLKD